MYRNGWEEYCVICPWQHRRHTWLETKENCYRGPRRELDFLRFSSSKEGIARIKNWTARRLKMFCVFFVLFSCFLKNLRLEKFNDWHKERKATATPQFENRSLNRRSTVRRRKNQRSTVLGVCRPEMVPLHLLHHPQQPPLDRSAERQQ